MMTIARTIFLIIILFNLQSCMHQAKEGYYYDVTKGATENSMECLTEEDLTPKIKIGAKNIIIDDTNYDSAVNDTNPYNSSDYNKNNYEEDFPITTDPRIKTYIYNPNNVYLLIVHYGFQSHIEFSKGEEVESIMLGDAFAWKMKPLENKLFINTLEKNIRTNMTIITNKKRTYQFDIVSKEADDVYQDDLVYAIKFYYPKKRTR